MTALTPALLSHLWQSTAFAALAFLLTLSLRGNRAAVRYGVWLAASVKFLVPFSLLVQAGSQFGPRLAPRAGDGPLSILVEEAGLRWPHGNSARAIAGHPSAAWNLTLVFAGVWLLGSIAVALSWIVRWRRMRAMYRATEPGEPAMLDELLHTLGIRTRVRLVCSKAVAEPAVAGIFRPTLWLPAGIGSRLEPAQLRAILLHELSHVRRRDNLASACHMLVEALFWFHPLVWWIGARLVEERERACDEEVLRLGGEPQAYAEGILQVCRFGLAALPCVSGVGGADLNERIRRIMQARAVRPLGSARKMLVSAAATAAVLTPVAAGILTGPPGLAQSRDVSLVSFEVASVKPSAPNIRGYSIQTPAGGRVVVRNAPLLTVIATAYNVEYQPFRLTGVPGWVKSERFDIEAKAHDPKASKEDLRRMLQSLLAERFGLASHRETRDLPMYSLVVVKAGPRLSPPEHTTGGHGVDFRDGGTRLIGRNATMADLAEALSFRVERPVIDNTGVPGGFDFKLEFVPDPLVARFGEDHPIEADPDGVPLLTALPDQLGLKLEASRGPVELIVVDRIERPSAN